MFDCLRRCPANLLRWFDARVPGVRAFYRRHLSAYLVPKTLNIWYCFGALALALIVNQVASGIFLSIHYLPHPPDAFLSVHLTLMRDVPYGWLVRSLHTTGASLLFVVLLLHIVRGFLYGSYRQPREIVWLLGLALYGVVMSEAFTGYVLPWGQMSFWGAKVISSLIDAIPWIGHQLVQWIFGSQTVGEATLSRFFIIHILILPLSLLALAVLHVLALHEVGSSHPGGGFIGKGAIDAQTVQRLAVKEIPFHPYYTIKDLLALSCLCCVAALIIFEAPQCAGLCLEPENAIEANRFVTPEHIRPAWYFSPFFAMLRGVPGQLPGLGLCLAAFALLCLLPWLDRGSVYAMHQRPGRVRHLFALIGISVLVLAILGIWDAAAVWQLALVRGLTAMYFLLFVTMPLWTKDKLSNVLNRVERRE